jgi:hypothetical protein
LATSALLTSAFISTVGAKEKNLKVDADEIKAVLDFIVNNPFLFERLRIRRMRTLRGFRVVDFLTQDGTCYAIPYGVIQNMITHKYDVHNAFGNSGVEHFDCGSAP